jgi:hypothetical protein
MNASMMRTQEQNDRFILNGMGFIVNGISKVKISQSDEKDENIATLLLQIDCFFREKSLIGDKF